MSIGLYVYRLTVRNAARETLKRFGSAGERSDPFGAISGFVTRNASLNDREDLSRSWYFFRKSAEGDRNIKGVIRYGTYGFESDLVDRKSRKSQYRRKSTDLEEIPLYFQFWLPPGSGVGFAVFQSFHGRSCVQMVLSSLVSSFEETNGPFQIGWNKIMPHQMTGSAMYQAPVKRVILVKKNAPSDLATRYLGENMAHEAEYEVSFRAKRRRTLGSLSEVAKRFSGVSAERVLILSDGERFDQAKAEVVVGKSRRTVGVFGSSSEAGAIEVSDHVKIGRDGHPVFESISAESDDILEDFYKSLAAK